MAERQADIEAILQDYPSTQSITIDLVELHSTTQDLAQTVLSRPDQALSKAHEVLHELIDISGPLQLQLKNNPHLCNITDISATQLYDLITVNGSVETVGPLQASVVTAQYTCPACNASFSTSSTGIERTEPTRCDACGWDEHFEFKPAQSEFVDTQRLTLTPASDQRTDDHQLKSLPVYVYGDLVDQVNEDDHIGVTGILRVRHSDDTAPYTLYLDGRGIREERDFSAPASLEAALDSYWET